MQKVKMKIPKKLRKGVPLSIRRGHTIRLEATDEPLTVHTGLSLFYAMAEAVGIPACLDRHVHVKAREAGYPESEHILTLSANAFVGGDFLDDLETLREDTAIQKAIGRKSIPDPTTAGDFCRRFSIGQILQMDKAFASIFQNVYALRKEDGSDSWTIDIDAKVHEVYGRQKQGAARAYNGVYSLQPLYAFVHETDELLHVQLRSGNTHPGDKAVPFLRRMKRKIPDTVKKILIRSDSALYNKKTVGFFEKQGWSFSITADQTAPLMKEVSLIPENKWEGDDENPSTHYAETTYQPAGWNRAYRYLIRRKLEEDMTSALFNRYSYYIVATDRDGDIKALMKSHAERGSAEKRIGQFSNEFLIHLPMGEFMANWVYLLCAQLAYNLSLWIRDLALPQSYRKKHIKRIRRAVGMVAAKVQSGGNQIRLKISMLHRWWKDFLHAWERVGMLRGIAASP